MSAGETTTITPNGKDYLETLMRLVEVNGANGAKLDAVAGQITEMRQSVSRQLSELGKQVAENATMNHVQAEEIKTLREADKQRSIDATEKETALNKRLEKFEAAQRKHDEFRWQLVGAFLAAQFAILPLWEYVIQPLFSR